MHRVGVAGQHGGTDGRRVPRPRRGGHQPAVDGQQPGQRDHRENRVGYRILAVEEPGGQQRRDHGHAVGGRAAEPEPAAGQVAQRHHGGADHRVDQQHGVIHGGGAAGEPVHRRDQKRIAALIQGVAGEVGRRAAPEDPRRDQVRGFVGIVYRQCLPAAEPRAQPGLAQPAGHQQQREQPVPAQRVNGGPDGPVEAGPSRDGAGVRIDLARSRQYASLLLVTQGPCHESRQATEMPRWCPAASLAGLILPHRG